jgi:DNA processing protein
MHSSSPGDLPGAAGPSTLPRSVHFAKEPGFFEPAQLWLYGNTSLLERELALAPSIFTVSGDEQRDVGAAELEAERLVLDGTVLVCGVHNDVHRRAAVVPLRWGAPRIVVLSGGFHWHLGPNLDEEPFRAARLWRYRWDPVTDLAVSRRAPDRLPTYARHNPSVDRLIRAISEGTWKGREAFHSEQEHVGSVLHRLVSTFVGAVL